MSEMVTVTKLKTLFEDFDKFQGVPRSELEERIMTLLAFVSRRLADERRINENLTNVQTRCTEQELELRKHRAESKLAGTPIGDFFLEAAHMNALALKKYPGPYSLEHMLCVLCEESGEAARAHCHKEGNEAIRLELSQVAGVCARIVTECLPNEIAAHRIATEVLTETHKPVGTLEGIEKTFGVLVGLLQHSPPSDTDPIKALDNALRALDLEIRALREKT